MVYHGKANELRLELKQKIDVEKTINNRASSESIETVPLNNEIINSKKVKENS